MTSPIIKQPRAVICALGVYSMEYSRIRIKSTPRDRKKLLTLRKVDYPISSEETQVLLKFGVALGACPLLVKISVNYQY